MIRSVLAALLLTVLIISPVRSAVTYTVPNFPDLMIKTRKTFGISHSMVTTLYLKGPRQRMEDGPESKAANGHSLGVASIMQCDQGALYHLSQFSKTYTVSYSHHRDLPEPPRRPVHALPAQPTTGPEVIVTIDSIDTGERRQLGSYQARHVKTTITIEPGEGAESHRGSVAMDGWYLDLPGLYCHSEQPEPLVAPNVMMWGQGNHDHRIIKHLGTAPHGFTVEEIVKIKEDGNVIINKTEMVAVSEDALDPSLFELPADYTERTPLLFHGTARIQPGQMLTPAP